MDKPLDYIGMKILITGICGFVGSALAKQLIAVRPDFEIFGIDNFAREGSWLNKAALKAAGVQVFHGDIRMDSDLEILPKADWVIDAAANPSVLAGIDGKTSSLQLIQNNLIATVNLLEYCKKHRAGFILLSTSRVYSIDNLCKLKMEIIMQGYQPDRNQDFPHGVTTQGVNEDYATQPPVSLYGCTKLASEQLALEYGITYNFPVWVNRCGVMAGPGQFGHPAQGIFAYWIHSFKENKPLKYIGFGGNGYQVRDCLHPRDLILLLLQQFDEPLDTAKPRIINISGGIKNTMSLAQLTSWCNQRFKTNNLVGNTSISRPFDIPWIVLDNARAKAIWGWQPETTIEQVLQEIAAFAQTHDNWLELSQS